MPCRRELARRIERFVGGSSRRNRDRARASAPRLNIAAVEAANGDASPCLVQEDERSETHLIRRRLAERYVHGLWGAGLASRIRERDVVIVLSYVQRTWTTSPAAIVGSVSMGASY